LTRTSAEFVRLLEGGVHRVFLSQLAPMSIHQGILALVLLYRLASVERLVGSARAFALAAVSASASALIGLGLFSASRGAVSSTLSCGPLTLVGVLVGVLGAAVSVPKGGELARVTGVPITEKTITILLALWFSLGEGLASLIPMATSVSLGAAFATNQPFLRGVALPSLVRDVASRMLGSVLSSSPPGEREALLERAARARDAEEDRQLEGLLRRMQRPQEVRARPVPRMEVDDDKVRMLVGMGFSERESREALGATQNDVELAVARIVAAREE
jgi:hypothetical protein